MVQPIHIRPLLPTESLADLTAMLRRAYAPLAARGLRYVASWQDEEITRRRIADGICLVAEEDGRIVGTVTVKRPTHTAGCRLYEQEGVALLGQFGVEPDRQGRGIGDLLLAEAERVAREQGFACIALDTAEGAADLIAYYERRGYRRVDMADWNSTNYRSVVLSKGLSPARPPGPAPAPDPR